ncbi:cytochrome b/b6 domain-containing protein [Halobacteriovorax marinus]|uniref:cytochrome b/b6 domain-containing protein n=1 Tax=Halobacteriovorax marinus TaxID=97084 RepID=UPI003A955FA5
MSKAKLSLTFRLLHWGVAFIVILNSFLLEEGKLFHRYLGYLCLLFVLIRLFISKKRVVTHYNEKAKYVYWFIWISIGCLSITGFMMGLDQFFGNQLLEDIHEVVSNTLLGLVVMHLLGISIDSYLNKRKTWMVMISGVKE